jgi:hypothetical protein
VSDASGRMDADRGLPFTAPEIDPPVQPGDAAQGVLKDVNPIQAR